MLSKRDKEFIRTIFREEMSLVFKRILRIEISPRKPGDPPKHEKEMEVNILDELVKYLPYVEGAIRGCQEDSNKALGKSEEVVHLIGALVQMGEQSTVIRKIGLDAKLIDVKKVKRLKNGE